MNWEAIAAVGQVLGALGVITSLIYLAAQVRQSNRASAVAAKLASTQQLSNFGDDLINSPDLMALWLRGRKDFACLTDDEHFRFSNMCLKAFWFFSSAEYQKRLGTLDEENWAEFYAVIRFWLDGPGVQAWWERTGRTRFGSSFVRFIDTEMHAPPEA